MVKALWKPSSSKLKNTKPWNMAQSIEDLRPTSKVSSAFLCIYIGISRFFNWCIINWHSYYTRVVRKFMRHLLNNKSINIYMSYLITCYCYFTAIHELNFKSLDPVYHIQWAMKECKVAVTGAPHRPLCDVMRLLWEHRAHSCYIHSFSK